MQVCVRHVNSAGIISAGIDFVTRSPVDHVELITPDGLRALGARSDGGVQLRELYYENFTLEERHWVEVDDIFGAEAWKWGYSQEGKGYDYMADAGIVFNRDWRDENKWMCSEFVTRFFEIARKPILRISPHIHFVTPGMTYISTELVDFGWKAGSPSVGV